MTNSTIHESPAISDTLCNGCLCMEVLVKKRKRIEHEKYWCAKKRCYVIPSAIKDCKSRRMEVPKVDASVTFNRGLRRL